MRTGQRDFPSCRVSCSVYKLRGAGQVPPVTAQGRAGHRPAGGVQLYCASLVFPQLYSFFSLLFITVAFVVFILFVVAIIIFTVVILTWFQLLNCSHLNSQILPLSSNSYSHLTMGRPVSKQLLGTELPAGVNPLQLVDTGCTCLTEIISSQKHPVHAADVMLVHQQT